LQIPGLGPLQPDEGIPEWLRSEPVRLSVLNGAEAVIVVSGYADDENKPEFHTAITNLLQCPREAFRQAEPYIFQNYQDINSSVWMPDDPEYLVIASPDRVREHVTVGTEPLVMRRPYGDKAIYVSFECECEWEPEHGLQIVLRNGCELVTIGPNFGHLTNSDAYDDERLETVIYRALAQR
jgi:hypothetical protein